MKALGEESLVLQQRIRGYERGESEITIGELHTIARNLSADVKELLPIYCCKGKDSENET
ncbi:MAG: hypothetical protein ACR5K2_03860 [Wolbachia sp.]